MSKKIKSKKKKKKQQLKKQRNNGNNNDIHHYHLLVTLGSIMYIVGLFVPFSLASSESHFTYFRILLFGHGCLFLMSFTFIASIYGFITKKKYWKIYGVFIIASAAEPIALFMNLISRGLKFGLGYYLMILGAGISLLGVVVIAWFDKYFGRVDQD